ncbi:hypothetical protein ACFY1P_08915 [Streptomyces sp. NPDC001407]|uniref:hypothetical protein n=1 Tax=unclassified Streptomyces TaxID=2593676 RepID=UPI00340C2444
MKPIRRALTTLAASVLLTVGAAALATPAHAESNVNLLGGLINETSNGAIHLNGITLPNPLTPVL